VHRTGPVKDLKAIARLVREQGAGTVVVGLPLLMSGEEGSRARDAREFAESLGRRLPGVAVELWDERLTTVQAERAMIAGNVRRKRRKQKIDTLAATLILQSYLDARVVT
jgi:putative Holliday junction resolvase